MGGKINKKEKERQNTQKILEFAENGVIERILRNTNNQQQTSNERTFLRTIAMALGSKGRCSDEIQNRDNNHRGPHGKGDGSAACAISLQENNNNNAITVG